MLTPFFGAIANNKHALPIVQDVVLVQDLCLDIVRKVHDIKARRDGLQRAPLGNHETVPGVQNLHVQELAIARVYTDAVFAQDFGCPAGRQSLP